MFRPLLFRKRLELDPAAVVLEDLRVVQLRHYAGLSQRPVQLLLRGVLVAARAKRDDLRGKDPPVDPAADAPHLREAAAADRPQVLEIPAEPLSGEKATSCCVIF